MKRRNRTHYTNSVKAKAAIGILAIIATAPHAQALSTQIDLEITYSNDLTSIYAIAYANASGFYTNPFNPPETIPVSDSVFDLGVSTASAGVGVRVRRDTPDVRGPRLRLHRVV